MPTTARHGVYLWVTWLTPTLAADASCAYAPWFKGHFKFDKFSRDGFDLAQWKVEHAAMVEARAAALTADGWTVYLEDQNAFTLKGTSAVVAGKPDIVAVKGDLARVIDCKGGRRRGSDYQQVLFYMLALPLSHKAVAGKRLVGEVQYRDGSVDIQPEEFTPLLRERIVTTVKAMGAEQPPAPTPSPGECSRCDIGPADCVYRMEPVSTATAVPGLF